RCASQGIELSLEAIQFKIEFAFGLSDRENILCQGRNFLPIKGVELADIVQVNRFFFPFTEPGTQVLEKISFLFQDGLLRLERLLLVLQFMNLALKLLRFGVR